MKKINDIKEIYKNGHFIVKDMDFSNMDLSNIDLSKIEPDEWKGAIFNHTNLSNTGIRFSPQLLKVTYIYTWSKDYYTINIIDCDFSNNDLSYLRYTDFDNIIIDGCHFKNTNLHINFNRASSRSENFSLKNVTLDSWYEKCDKLFWEGIDLDLQTLLLNPNIHLSVPKIFKLIKAYLPKTQVVLSPQDITNYAEYCESLLHFDESDSLKRLYETIKNQLTPLDKLRFFQGVVSDKSFENITFTNIPANLWNEITFSDCHFKNVTIDTNIIDLINKLRNSFIVGTSKDDEIYFPTIQTNNWYDIDTTRLGHSDITFRTNLYLELGRNCNAKCPFCRNQSFPKCSYRYDQIKTSLGAVYKHLNDIVIGGGEPTLRLKDLLDLRYHFDSARVNWYLFTNGSLEYDELINLREKFKFNISRHAINDEDNARIFKLSKGKILSTNELEKLSGQSNNTTICCTCFKGGVDTPNKVMDYIRFVQSLGFDRILFSNLHADASLGDNNLGYDNLTINENIFEEVKAYLRQQGFMEKLPIYSTGGYIADIMANDSLTVVFKTYISKKELESHWPKALKRTFDLSIDPSGQIFENWHQTSNEVKVKKI